MRCCDICDSGLVPKRAAPSKTDMAGLDEAILTVVRNADPAVGRTSCAAIVHGAQTKKIERNSYDGLAGYGVGSHLRRDDILARIDELVESGAMSITDGRYPVLRVARRARA